MPSPACNVSDNGGGAVSTLNGVDVANDGTTVKIILADQGGVRTWSCSIVGTDDQVVAPTVTVDDVTKTATFTKPAGPWALIFQSQINGGLNNGLVDPTYTTTFGIYVKTASKSLRLGAANERAEGSTAFGWTTKVNAAIKTADAAGGGSGTASWLDGTDTAYTVAAATGVQNVRIPALTANRAWKLSNAAASDGMRVTLDDSGYSGSTSGRYTQAGIAGYAITVSGFNGTEHIYAEGKDQGTSYAVPAALLGNGRLAFEYRSSDSTWHLA